MWKVILVLMAVTTADQRIIVQQPIDKTFASQAECNAFATDWQRQVKQPELLRLAEARDPAHRGSIKTASLLDAGCADPGWSGAFPILKAEEGYPPPAATSAKPTH